MGDPVPVAATQAAQHEVEQLEFGELLIGAQDNVPNIRTPENRSHISRNTHQSGIQPARAQPLGVQWQLNYITATIENLRVVSNNRCPDKKFKPLYKRVAGKGHNLALTVSPNLPPNLQNWHPKCTVGSVPDFFNPKIEEYQDIDILKLIIYYNEDFGLVHEDALVDRQIKLGRWLRDA